ncbi:MAG: hypothetical protein H7326_01130 [Bdellovibrionaceae bacterium]|nr:hypothetical protein [Pseudobdellovibrionaceae bacterium]
MKTVLSTLAIVLATTMSFAAHAQETLTYDTSDNGQADVQADIQAAPAWACSMAFEGKGQGLKVILGRYRFLGYGVLNCTNVTGHHASYKVKITMRTGIVSPGVSIGKFEMKGRAADISLANSSPKALLGDYYIAQGQGAIVGGVGLLTAVKVGAPQLALKISVQFVKGFGINLSLNKMNISLAE